MPKAAVPVFCLLLLLLAGLAPAVPPAAAAALRVGTTALPPSLGMPFRFTGTPHISTWSAIFDGLTRIDASGEVEPWLATRWEATGPLTWQIELRRGVTFSNGVPFTAAAVVTVVEYFLSPESARDVVARELGFIKEARAIDDYTVELVTHQPAPYLPRALPIMYMVEPGQWRRLGPEGFAREPIGTGPFAVTRMAPARWELDAVAGAWRPPKVDHLEFIVAPDAAARVQGVLADRLDIALFIGPDEAAAIEAGGGKGMHWPVANVWSIQFDLSRDTPMRNPRVREALNYAIDRDALTEGLLGGATVPATQPAPRVAYGYNPDLPPIPYDPERARRLLAEAGYPGGFRFTLEGVVGAGPADGAMFQLVAQDLADIGVEMEIRQIPVPQLIRNVVEGGWGSDAFGLMYATEPTIDALRPLTQHSCLWPHPWYCDQRIMPTIEAAFVEQDESKALALRRDIMAFYREQYAGIFLYEFLRFGGTRADVSGFEEVHGFVNYDAIEVAP